MIKRITAIIMTIIICCGVFVMPVYAVDYSTMTEGFENIDLDELTDEELEALYENPYFTEWYQQTIGGVNPNTLYTFYRTGRVGNIAGEYTYFVPAITDEDGIYPVNLMVFRPNSYSQYYIYYTVGVYTNADNSINRKLKSTETTYQITITDSTASFSWSCPCIKRNEIWQ